VIAPLGFTSKPQSDTITFHAVSSRRRFACLAVLALSILLSACAGEDADTPPTTQPPAVDRTPVQIFLGSGDPNDCAAVTPVERQVEGEATLEKGMRALLAGPTEAERNQGLGGWFDERTADMLISAEVVEGVARVDLRDLRPVIPNASSSCGSAMLLAQLDGTARQFDGVSRTLYSLEGDIVAFYDWLQMGVPDA
jgi:hypothetical protein